MDNLDYFKSLQAIHSNLGRDEICESFGYSSEDFETILDRYNKLKIAESAGAIYIEKQISPVSLSDYIKYKIWFLTGPDAYYNALDDLKEMCELRDKALNHIKTEHQSTILQLKTDHKNDIAKINDGHSTVFILICFGLLIYMFKA